MKPEESIKDKRTRTQKGYPSKPKPDYRLTETIARTPNLLEMTRTTCLSRIQTKGIEPHRINLFTTKYETNEDRWATGYWRHETTLRRARLLNWRSGDWIIKEAAGIHNLNHWVKPWANTSCSRKQIRTATTSDLKKYEQAGHTIQRQNESNLRNR